jgi:hypothetical protein
MGGQVVAQLIPETLVRVQNRNLLLFETSNFFSRQTIIVRRLSGSISARSAAACSRAPARRLEVSVRFREEISRSLALAAVVVEADNLGRTHY